MKIRRILATVLAFAMVITASPLENVRFEAAGETTKTILASDTTYMLLSNVAHVGSGGVLARNVDNKQADGMRDDKPYIATLRESVIGQFNKASEEWFWFAYRINAPETKTYTLGVQTNGCKFASYTIPLYVDNEVYSLNYTESAQSVTTDVTLSKGEHIVVMFAPMPKDSASADSNVWIAYPWCDVKNVIYDSELTVVENSSKQLTVEDVEASFYVQSGNTNYVTYDHMDKTASGGYEPSGTQAGGVKSSLIKQTISELVTTDGLFNYLAKESLPYVQYIVDTRKDGKYQLNIDYHMSAKMVDKSDNTAFAVIVNDKLYKVLHETTGEADYSTTVEIELKKGRNVIRTTGLISGTNWKEGGSWINFNDVYFEQVAGTDCGVQFVPVSQTTVNGGDENFVLSNVFTDKGNTLGGLDGTTAGPIRSDIPTIDILPYAADLIERWPFAAVKVTAEKDGFYDITVNAGINTGAASFQLGMLVDGTSYSMPFKNVTPAGIDASVYLTAGDHVITFLIPMPENVYDAREANGTYYPWMDYNSITFGTGLIVQDAPTINDIKAHLGTTISVGDESLLVNKFNEVSAGSADKIRHNKYASPDRSVLTAKNITLENVLNLGYDKLPYIAYEVNVENAGTYEVGAIVKTKAGTTSQMGLIIDGTQVKEIPLAATGKEEFVSTSVELSAGKHTLMLTCAMPKDSTSTVDYPWLDVFELCISNGATIGDIHAQDENVTVEMEDTTYVSGGSQTPYAGASSGKVVGTKINASEKLAEIWKSDGNKLLQIDWGQMNYAEFATTGTAGEHEIQLKVIATCTPDKKIADKEPEVYVYVNGEVYKKQLDAWNTFETITITADLVEGINVFKCFAVADDASGDTSIFFDTLYFDTTKLTAVSLEDVAETKTEISFADTTQVFTHKYPVSEDGTKLANPVAGDMQYRKYYIDALNINQLTYVPYAAVKVAAENAGYYEIEIEANVKTGDAAADCIAMLVDGKAYTLRYKKSGADTLSTMIYLEKGTHMLIFTSPMPQTYDEVKDVVYPTGENADFTELKNLYPWFDMKTLILDEGLSIVEKPGYGDIDFSEVIDSVDTIIDAGDETLVLPDNYNDNDAILDDAARDELKNNRVSLETLLLHGFDKAPYASFKVTAPADGTYDIYALVATDANLTSDQIAFIVDRMQVYAVTVEKKADNQIIHAIVELTKGTHSIIFTSPMPFDDEEAQAIPEGETDNWAGMNSKYRWMNYIRFGIDKDLTLESGNTAPITSGIEAEDSEYVKYHGNYEVQIYPGATDNHAVNGKDTATVPGIIDKDALFHDLSKLSFIEFAVDAQSAGTQNITLGVIATNADNNTADTVPVLMVYANGKWQEVSLENWNTFEEVTVSVDLIEGKNIIRCAAEWRGFADGTRVIFDYIEYDTSALTAVKVEDFATGSTTYNAGDENNILANKYTDNGDSLGGASCADMRWSKYYIDGLKVTQLPRIPYAAVKVNAEAAGYYDIGMTAGVDASATSEQIAVLVDGKAYPLTSGTTMIASIYLEAGVHTLIFTSPMPVDKATADTSSSTNETKLYPWLNMDTITLGEGLEVTEKITTEEVMLAEVLRSVHGLTAAGDDTIVLPNRYTDNNDVLDGADRNDLKNNRVSVETLLVKGFDKAPFASFNVTAKEDGTYDIYALVSVNSALISKQVVVIVDRTRIVSVPVEAVEGTQMIHASLTLDEGTHNIIFTAPMPQTDAEAQALLNDGSDNWAGMNKAYPWMNYEYFAIDKDLTVETGIKDSTTTGIEAEDSTYIKYTGAYEVLIYPGASSAQAVIGSTVKATDFDTTVDYYDWSELSCMEFAVNAQSAGRYQIDIGLIATNAEGKLDVQTPELLVYANGEWHIAEITKWNAFGKVTLNLDLTEGVNTVKCIAAYREEVAGTRVIYDYIELATGLTKVKTTDFETGTAYNGSADSIAVNRYNKGTTLNGASLGDMRWSRYYVEGLEMSEMHRVPYAAVEVTVEEERYYDIVIDASPNTAGSSTQIALIVDGKAYPMTFVTNDTTTLSASIKLTEGTHLLMFTSPMPKTVNDRPESTNDTAAYPWFNFDKFYFDNGMQLTEDVNVTDVIAKVEETTKVSKNWSSYKDSNEDQVTDYLSVITDDMKSNRVSIETLLEVGLTRIPYISVTVKAEQDGWYDVYATVNAKSNRSSEQIAMIVDGTKVHTISLVSGDKNQNIGRYIYLKKGTHTITMTAAMPATDAQAQAITDPSEDQWAAMNQAYPWFNFYSFTIDGRLEVVEGEANPLKDASALFVGDSITNGNRTDIKDGVSWANKIGTWNGMDYTNAGIKGATISALGDKIIRHQLMGYASQDFDYLIMHGGINDAMSEAPIGEIEDSYDVADFDNSTFIGALETEFYYAYENFDGAKMGYIINYATPRSDWGGYTQDPSEYYNAIKQVCAKWNIPYIDLFEGKVVVDGQELSYSYDILKVDSEDKNFASNKSTEIHLSDEGYRVISPYIEAWMKTLSVNPNPLQEENRWKYVEAGNIDKVLFNGFTKSEGQLIDRVYQAMGEDEASIELLPYAKDMIGDWAFASIKVNAETAGDYRIFVEMSAKNETQMGMLVDGEAYTLNYSKNDGFFEYMGQTVSLSEGTHYITFTTAMPEKNADVIGAAWTIYPWTNMASIVVDPGLKVLAKPTLEEITSKLSSIEDKGDMVVDAGNETNVLAKDFDDQGDTLGNTNAGDLRWDALTLDEFTYDNLARMPYFAMKVTAEEDGYYDVLLRIDTNEKTISDQLGLLIDGKELQILSFVPSENTKVNARIYLEKGTHTLTFTSPMPETKAEFEAYLDEYNANLPEGEKELTRGNGITHPWMDVNSVTLSKGLTVESVPTRDEIEAPFYNRVEAENGDYVLYNNYEPTPEASKNASNGYVIGGQMRWIFEQTFEELTAWLDAKHNSYIEYAVVAPADGKYNIRLGFLAGAKDESVEKPYIAVIVNGTTHKVQYTEEWNEIQKTELTVSLKEGLNIIRCTSYTIEQEGYEGRAWINHDFLDIDKSLTAVKRSSVKVEAENSAFVNKFKVQDGEDYEKASGKVLGSADRKYVSGLKMTLDQISLGNLKQIPYVSFTVEAPANGYYAMSMDMATDGRLKRGTIGVLVDGQMNVVKYARTGKSTAEGRADMLIYLTKGEHVLTFTIPMPEDATTEFNYSYNMANFDSLTLYDGLKLAKTQKAPTTEADYTRFEVEEHVMYNLNSNNGTAAGNAYYKVSQSVAEMFRDGIDGTRTPYAELTIRASEAGAYTLYVGTSYGMTEGCTQDEIEATFVVDTNGKLQTKTVQATKKSTWSIVPVTVNLEKGTNKVRMTHFGSDSQCGGTTWIDFDYIEVSESTAAKLNFAKTGITLEAEEGIFVGYNAESGEAYHNGQYVGSADYGYVDENDVTFENLKPDDLDEMPHVTYNFEVEKAGTYTLSIGFAAGLYHHLTAEMAEGRTGGFAVIVNGTSKQLVEFELTTASSHLSRNITVDLIEGENEITVTTTLADYIIAHTPRDDEKYRLIWVDHDYMVLSEGLSRGKEPEKYGLEDSDYNHAQITLKSASEENDDNAANDNKKPGGIIGAIGAVGDVIKDITKNTPVPVLVGMVAVLSAAVGYFIVLYRKKKAKQKNIEESSK